MMCQSVQTIIRTAGQSFRQISLNDVFRSVDLSTTKSGMPVKSWYRSSNAIGRLPAELSAMIMTNLDARSLNSLSCTCQQIRLDCASIIPGLKIRLYPHQFNSGTQ